MENVEEKIVSGEREPLNYRVGNFIVKEINENGVPFMEVSEVSGYFSMRYSIGCVMFAALRVDDELSREAVRLILTNACVAANVLDAEYQKDLLVASGNYIKRCEAESDKDSLEDGETILSRMKEEESLKEAMEELDEKMKE